MKERLQQYKHAWIFLYALIYLPWFYWLEQTVTDNFHVIYVPFDDKIPFIECFIVPYFLWFLFMAVTVLYFFFTNKKEFYQVMTFLIIGMTVFLIVSTIYPNGQQLRPEVFERNNIFTEMVKRLYLTDTPTNIFPSIHVYNTLGLCISVLTCERLRKNYWIAIGSVILSTLIVLSTLFLKQHSVLDAISAGALAIVAYYIVYRKKNRKNPLSA